MIVVPLIFLNCCTTFNFTDVPGSIYNRKTDVLKNQRHSTIFQSRPTFEIRQFWSGKTTHLRLSVTEGLNCVWLSFVFGLWEIGSIWGTKWICRARVKFSYNFRGPGPSGTIESDKKAKSAWPMFQLSFLFQLSFWCHNGNLAAHAISTRIKRNNRVLTLNGAIITLLSKFISDFLKRRTIPRNGDEKLSHENPRRKEGFRTAYAYGDSLSEYALLIGWYFRLILVMICD